jgi:hypothetical protein
MGFAILLAAVTNPARNEHEDARRTRIVLSSSAAKLCFAWTGVGAGRHTNNPHMSDPHAS